jgi:hypothetical protein
LGHSPMESLNLLLVHHHRHHHSIQLQHLAKAQQEIVYSCEILV